MVSYCVEDARQGVKSLVWKERQQVECRVNDGSHGFFSWFGLKALHVVQLLVIAVEGDQFVVCAALYDASFVYDAYLVGVLYG